MRWIGRLMPALALVLVSLPALGDVGTWYVSPTGDDGTGIAACSTSLICPIVKGFSMYPSSPMSRTSRGSAARG